MLAITRATSTLAPTAQTRAPGYQRYGVDRRGTRYREGAGGQRDPSALTMALDSFSRTAVLSALRQSGRNRAQAAKLLQMNRTALSQLMKKLNIRG